jgi:hypothetical protein
MKLEQVFYGSGRKSFEETIIFVVVVLLLLLIHSWLEREREGGRRVKCLQLLERYESLI